MSHCKDFGKDQVVFLTEEDALKPSSIEFTPLAPGEGPQGLVTDSGDINWNCPCLGGMAVGPCGVEFREAFSCFHHSESETRGSECYDKFATMQNCMKDYPEVYERQIRQEEDDGENDDVSKDGQKIVETPQAEGNTQTEAPKS